MKENTVKHKTSYPQLDRRGIIFKPLSERVNRKEIKNNFVLPAQKPGRMDKRTAESIHECAERIIAARSQNGPVIMAFGAHAIKNGLGLVMIRLIEDGWITHLATNGAGIIHDWEFAFQGMTGEDVKTNISSGRFGLWQETGFFINLALNVGAYEGKGYGESIGALIHHEKLIIPTGDMLDSEVMENLSEAPSLAAAAAELKSVTRAFDLAAGALKVPHPWKTHSVQAAAFRNGIPFTGHPMIGHDIIYCHPMNNGTLLGKAALCDFLSFADSVSRVDNGVYLSIGSAVMSPMIFEKALSMAQNIALEKGRKITRHYICVVDIAGSEWNWAQGEPPETHPAYYQRYNKTFSRMGGTHRYLSVDNRDFLLALHHTLKDSS